MTKIVIRDINANYAKFLIVRLINTIIKNYIVLEHRGHVTPDQYDLSIIAR